VEARLRQLEGRALGKISGAAKGKAKIESYDKDRKKDTPGLLSAAKAYNPAADSTVGVSIQPDSGKKTKDKKREVAQVVEEEVTVVQTLSSKKKSKKDKTPKAEAEAVTPVVEEIVQVKEKSKKRKVSKETAEDIQVTEAVATTTTTTTLTTTTTPSEVKSSKKKRKAEAVEEAAVEEVVQEKKKKKKVQT
jgi:nucleolar protein 58